MKRKIVQLSVGTFLVTLPLRPSTAARVLAASPLPRPAQGLELSTPLRKFLTRMSNNSWGLCGLCTRSHASIRKTRASQTSVVQVRDSWRQRPLLCKQ